MAADAAGSETSERSKLGLRTGKERYILFITI